MTLVLPMAATAQAATEATPIVPTDHGLSEPAGVAVTPDDAIWVSDGIKGLCRVSGAELVEDELGYCAPKVEVPAGQPEPGPLGGTAVSIPVAGSPAADEAVSAVAADTVRGVVYAGTSTGGLTDKVLMATADGFLPDTYDEGYANVTALGMGTGGALLIAHDPSAALSPGVDTPNQAELFSRPLGALDRPRVTFTRTPQPVQRDSAPADVVFTWVARAGATFECTVDGGAPFACGDTWSPAESLFEGAHELKVRADHGGWGPMATWHFEIDQTAPEVSIDAGTPREAVGGALRVGFTSGRRLPDCKYKDGEEQSGR